MEDFYHNADNTRKKIVNDMLEAEAKMLQCLVCLFCDNLAESIANIEDPVKKAEVTQTIICAYACKESAMSKLVDVLRKFDEMGKTNCYFNE